MASLPELDEFDERTRTLRAPVCRPTLYEWVGLVAYNIHSAHTDDLKRLTDNSKVSDMDESAYFSVPFTECKTFNFKISKSCSVNLADGNNHQLKFI